MATVADDDREFRKLVKRFPLRPIRDTCFQNRRNEHGGSVTR